MIKHFCDRCKKETNNYYTIELNSTRLEICEDCDKKLEKFLKEAD